METMVAQQCECFSCHQAVHFQMVKMGQGGCMLVDGARFRGEPRGWAGEPLAGGTFL